MKTLVSLVIAFLTPLILIPPSLALPLSLGDRLEVSIPNEKYFAGVYEVNQKGDLEIPYLGYIAVLGLEPEEVQKKLSQALIKQEFFLPGKLKLSIQVLKWAPVQISVAGEVFQPGRVLINEASESQAETSIASQSRQITGNYPFRRYLTTAIRAAGGILPTADVKQIRLQRGNQEKIVDLSGAFTGEPLEDVPLIAGDRIIVPSAERVQPELVRPSQITPPGIKVFVSNLTIPANSNSTSAVGNQQEGITFPYGARFSHSVISANCAGGITDTNADRLAILVRVNPLTGETAVTQRKVEDLLRNSTKDSENPLLMPRDGVVCYDSSVTSIRDVFRTITDILSPLNPVLLFRNLFR